MASTTLLQVRDVIKHFGGVRAVDGATFDVTAGSITALIGPNGAGKSSLFNVISGFDRPDHGDVLVDGRSIRGHAPHQIARQGIARTFQLTKTFQAMTVLDNLLVATPDHPGDTLGGVTLRARRSRARERRAREEATELLRTVALEDKADEYAGHLSGGQRKLLELARALMRRPRMVLLDEPMAGVNPALGRRLLAHIERLRDEHGLTFLFIEHDLPAVMRHSDRVVCMAQGRVIADGPPEQVRNDPAVIEAYVGGRAASAGPGGAV